MNKIIAVVVLAILFVGCGKEIPRDPQRVQTNKAIMEQCLAVGKCAGGFVKVLVEGNSDILRIVQCDPSSTNCGSFTISQSLLEYEGWLNCVEIILPEDARWSEVAVQHARQFVPRK